MVVRELGHKVVARRHGFFSEYQIWGIKHIWFSKDPRFPTTVKFFGKDIVVKSFPLGLVLSVLLTIFSNGQLFFAAIGSYHLMLTSRASRFGRKFVNVTDYEEAKIALGGPAANLLLVVIFKIFNSSGTFDDLILINSALAIFNLIPLSTLDGAKIYFGSKPLYILSLVFIVGSITLIYLLGVIPSLILAAIISLIFLVTYYYLRIYK
ncbi:hypothetical protein HY643_02485 [Candidatus Woesearchaeota archaeon]|nr:hypothetical protein [Candidatus Woesearchaeota archaeon]